MSIDPNLINTARVGELPIGSVSLTNKIAHEISNELKQATVQELADVIGAYLGTTSGLAFNPITVSDGQTLPNTTSNEWVLVGKGTFPNVGGGATITTTEELNALVSNGSTWSVGVEIPVNVELAGIVQTIREGYTQTTPSEDKVFKALQLKADSLTYDNITAALGFTAENAANKQNSLSTDGTGAKFPTVDAVKNRFDNYTTQRSTISEIRVMAGDLRNNLFYTTDLGQEGNWYYDATDTMSADNTGTVLVTADGKRIKRIFDVLTPEMFGCKGDGITDDATNLQKALNLGLPINFKHGSNYLVSAGFTITDKDVIIKGNNSKITTTNVSDNYIINHLVTNNTKYNVNSITQGVVGINTYTTIVFTGIISGIKKGDIMKLFSSDLAITTVANVYKGEFVSVNNVSNDGTNTTITVYEKLDYTYLTDIKIAKIKKYTVDIKDLTVYSGSETHALGFAYLKGTYNAKIDNAVVNRTDWPFITATGCYRPTIINPVVNYVGDSIDGNSSVVNAIGYGINDNNCYGLQIIGGNLSNLRHSYTTGGSVSDLSDYDQYGESNGSIISGVVAKNCQTAFDTHEPGYNITFNNCHADASRIGFQTRSRNVKINNCTTNNVTTGVNIRNLNGVSASENNGIYINNLVMSGASDVSIQATNIVSNDISYIRINGGHLIGNLKLYDSNTIIKNSDIFVSQKNSGWATVNNSRLEAYRLNITGTVDAFAGVTAESTDPCYIKTKDLTIDISTSSVVYITRATSGSVNKTGIFENTTYLNASPSMSEATATRPYTGDDAFLKFKFSFKKEYADGTAYEEKYSNRLVVRPDISNKILFGNKYIMDDIITVRFSLLTANSSIDTIDIGTHPGQLMILTNPNNFTVTFNNITNIAGDNNAIMKAQSTMILVYDGTGNTWTSLNNSFDRLRDKPTTITGYGITDAFINKGAISDNTNLNTVTSLGNYFRGSNTGNTTSLNYPSTLKGHLLVYPFTSSELIQIYVDSNGTMFNRINNSSTWGVWYQNSGLKAYTISGLPTGKAGDTAYVVDALSPTYLGTLTPGGAVKCPVFFNGTAWVSH